MITLSLKPPHIRSIPDAMRPFVKAGKVADISRPRILGNGIFAAPTGYGVSAKFSAWSAARDLKAADAAATST